jgi:hypothetical protein
MTIVNGYATLADLKTREKITTTDTTRDAHMEQMIEAASRWIDGITGRQFYATSATYYFTARDNFSLRVTDLLSVTTLKTDLSGARAYETTWDDTDFDLCPYNTPPYQWIEVAPNGLNLFPLTRRGVQIAGSWGYSATTPDAVNEACLLVAARLYKRKDAIFGVSGVSQLGQTILRLPKDDDVIGLLGDFTRRGL